MERNSLSSGVKDLEVKSGKHLDLGKSMLANKITNIDGKVQLPRRGNIRGMAILEIICNRGNIDFLIYWIV
jgi:hypothetical protein